jgi:hypothetical protein
MREIDGHDSEHGLIGIEMDRCEDEIRERARDRERGEDTEDDPVVACERRRAVQAAKDRRFSPG